MMYCKECNSYQPNKHFLLGGYSGSYQYRGRILPAMNHTPTMPDSEGAINSSIITRLKAVIRTQAEDLAKTEQKMQHLQEEFRYDENIIETLDQWLHKNLGLGIEDIILPTDKGRSFPKRK